MAETSMRGRFVWHELMTVDPKGAVAFYGKLAGWKPKPWDKDPSYVLMTAGGRNMAGIFPIPEEAKANGSPSQWFSYIATPDADATARQAAELGGKVLRKVTQIPGIGRFAILQDPQGAVFCAFTPLPGPPPPPGHRTKPGLADFSWHELTTSDWKTAFSFYEKLFGWEKTDAMDMGEMGVYQMFGWKGNTLGGMFNQPPDRPSRPAWLAYILVPDSKSTAKTVKRLGGQVINGPMQVPGGSWIAQATDPEGVIFAVHSAAKAAAAPAKTSKKSAPAKKAKKAKKAKAKSAATKASARKSSSKKATKKKATKKKVAKSRAPRRTSRKGGKKR